MGLFSVNEIENLKKQIEQKKLSIEVAKTMIKRIRTEIANEKANAKRAKRKPHIEGIMNNLNSQKKITKSKLLI